MSGLAVALLMLAAVSGQQAALPQGPEPPITTVVAAEARFEALRESLIAKVRAGTLPSIAVAVSQGGRTIWEEAIGWADREGRVGATPATSYAVGSLSKSLTAITLLALVDRGVLALDAPLDGIHLPTRTDVRAQPTLRQLLDASGGVPHGWRQYAPADAPQTQADWDAWVAQNAFLAFPPGVVFEYSNNSFGVAARVAERATGSSFAEVTQQYLFAPLGMGASYAKFESPFEATTARPYSAGGTPLPRTASVPEAGLGMFASAADLARFGNFLRGHRARRAAPVSPGLRAMIWQPAAGPSREFFHFGFWNGGRTLVTNGNIGGANAHLAIGRDTDVVVAVTVNQTGNDADEAAGAIVDLLIPADPGAPDVRAVHAALYDRPYRGPPAMLGMWTGTVLLEDSTIPVSFEARADSALIRFGSGAWLPVSRLRLSAYGELRGSVSAIVSGLTTDPSEPVRIDLVLKWEGALLRGYALPRGATAQPAAVRLEPAP